MSDGTLIRLGLCLAAYGGLGLPAALAEAADHGPLCLDLPTDTTLGLVDARRCVDDGEYRDEVAKAVTGLGNGWPVTCVSNSRDAQLLLGPHGPHTDPVSPGTAEDKRAHAVQCAVGSIRLAERLGVTTVRLLVGCPDFARWLSWWGSDVSWADNIAEFFARAEPVLRTASEAGVTVLLEPHPKQIVYDRSSAEELLRAAGRWSDVLALCIDPANLAAIGHDPVTALTGWHAGLAAVHAKDLQRWPGPGKPPGRGWSRYGPQPPIRFRALGLGALDWSLIVSTLIDECFSGVLYAEHEDVLLPRRQSIGQTLKVLRDLLPADASEGRTW
ncbi:MAG: sugar phosphate isomerase/epimerase [Streptosporangiaceae bacterium]|nr:sugar phosphate isomerase/epimerase [Streptosporangiaceae bacterium]